MEPADDAPNRPAYDPAQDYRQYRVSSRDAPFLTTQSAARLIGYKQSESVRLLVRGGRLPSRRGQGGYNPRIEIPEWAVQGWMTYKGITGGQQNEPVSARIQELEQALLILRAAGEHERKARRLLEDALRESGHANDLLSEAVGSVVVPSHLPEQ